MEYKISQQLARSAFVDTQRLVWPSHTGMIANLNIRKYKQASSKRGKVVRDFKYEVWEAVDTYGRR